jgi:hypothetical protein
VALLATDTEWIGDDGDESDSPPDQCGDAYTESVAAYACMCAVGCIGDRLYADVNEGVANARHHGKTYADVVDMFSSDCTSGYDDGNIAINIHEDGVCPCLHGATCTDACAEHWRACELGCNGYGCKVDIDECDSLQCRQGATCMEAASTDDSAGYWRACEVDCSGYNCNTDIDECDSLQCRQGATYMEAVDAYSLDASAGYLRASEVDRIGYNYDIDSDECDSLQYWQGATFMGAVDACSIEAVDAYPCICTKGYSGETGATNMGEQASLQCQPGAACTNVIEACSFTCAAACIKDACGVDDNECGSNPCRHGATCVNTVDVTMCTCTLGYGGEDDRGPPPGRQGATRTDVVVALSGTGAASYGNDTYGIGSDVGDLNACQDGDVCAGAVDECPCTQLTSGTNGRNPTVTLGLESAEHAVNLEFKASGLGVSNGVCVYDNVVKGTTQCSINEKRNHDADKMSNGTLSAVRTHRWSWEPFWETCWTKGLQTLSGAESTTTWPGCKGFDVETEDEQSRSAKESRATEALGLLAASAEAWCDAVCEQLKRGVSVTQEQVKALRTAADDTDDAPGPVLLEYSEPSGKLLGDIEGPQSLERHATELKTSHVKAYKSQHDGLATTLTERSQLSEQHASVPEVHGVYLRTTCSGRKAGGARHILVHTSPNVDTACADNPDERSDQPLREFQSALACKETTTEIRATMQSSAFQLRSRFAELRAGSGVDRVHATPELQAGPSADRVCVTSWASACERLEARAQVVWPGLYQGEPAGFMPWKGSLAEKA